MAIELIVEDGSVIENANTYISLEDMKSFWDLWGHNYTGLTEAEIKLLIINAAELLDTMYYFDWPGSRASSEQMMEWPRRYANYIDGQRIDSSTIPIEVKKAQAKICYLTHSGHDLQPILGKEGTLRSKRERVEGAIDTEYEYDRYTGRYVETYLPLHNILKRLLGNLGRFGRLNLKRN